MRKATAALVAAAALAMPFAGAQTAIQARRNAPGEVLTPPRRSTRQERAARLQASEAAMLAASAKRLRRSIKATRDWERQERGQQERRQAFG
jgi:hypothetical protein